MVEPLYVITGATGNVACVAANALLDKKKRVRVVGRDPAKLKSLAGRGAETAIGSLDDVAFLRKAFDGAAAAFVMIPPNFATKDYRGFQKAVVAATAAALEAAKVRHAVTLSSIGAHLDKGNGPIAGLFDLEQRMNRVQGLNVLHLRPGFFMENHLMNVGMMKSQGMNGGPIRGDLPIAMIATRDIGAVAAARLAALDFDVSKGSSVLELMGPRDVTMNEATAAFAKALGKPGLRYVQFPYEDARKAMVGMGLAEDLAGLYVEMARGFNEGKVTATQSRSPKTTTPTTIDAFAAAAMR